MNPDSSALRFLGRRCTVVGLLFCASCLLLGTALYLFRPGPVQRLQPYIGKDLRALSEDEQIKVDELIGCLAPEAKQFEPPTRTRPRSFDPLAWRDYFNAKPKLNDIPEGLFFRSWYLWRVQERLVLFQGRPLFMIPGSSSARIYIFDTVGRQLTKNEFQTGWRIDIDDARWVADSGHGFPCLLVESSPAILGGGITCQYYAFLQDSFALVRLEDRTGKVVPVDYDSPSHAIGPAVPERTPDQWEAVLHSSDHAEVLRTLVWLGGRHSDPPPNGDDSYIERFEEANRALVTRRRPGVRTAVEALSRSEDGWVREAAQHAWKSMQDAGR